MDRDPPADRPPVEAVDRGRQVRPVPVEPELRDVGDHEQVGRGRAEVVRPVRAQWDVGRALRELAPVAAVPRPPAHLRRLAGSVEKVGVRALAAPVSDIRNQLIS